MELTKLSASAMNTFELCPSRYVADLKAGRSGQRSGRPAMIGSICHRALELYVTDCILSATYARGWPTLRILLMQAYMEIADDNDLEGEEFLECEGICKSWLGRMTFEGFKVVSTEIKKNFPVYGLPGELTIPFNYIMDRVDQLDEKIYRVVDYKTFQQPITVEELHNKLQARVYALALQIEHPEAERIWVSFDLLRHDRAVQTWFNRDQNIHTWKRILKVCHQIIELKQDEAPELLNNECGFCIKKTTCSANLGNIDAGGVQSYAEDFSAAIDARALLKINFDASKRALEELDDFIMTTLRQTSQPGAETALTKLEIKRRRQSSVNPELVRSIVGDDIFFAYGDPSMNQDQYKKLLEDDRLSPEQLLQLEDAKEQGWSKSWLQTKPKKKDD